MPSSCSNAPKRLRSSARSIESGDVPMIGTPACVQTHREIQRSLSAKLHDHAFRFFNIDDVHHIFERERLEVETIGSVVVGRDCFRIAVDHDRLETGFAQRKRSMTAAVVKLDSLPDAIRTRAEDHDLAPVGWLRFVFRFVG